MQQDESAAAAHEVRELDEVVQRLQDRFPGIDRDRIRAAVTDAHREFDGRPIRDFVPVFVERTAGALLSSPAKHSAAGTQSTAGDQAR